MCYKPTQVFLLILRTILVGLQGYRAAPQVFLFLLCFCSVPPASAQSSAVVDVLIITYDMGDFHALQPVSDYLTSKGYSSVLLKFGASGKKSPPSSGDYARETMLEPETLEKFISTYNPRVVLAGMASALQAQLLNAYATKNSITIAYYDNCEDPQNKDYIIPFMKLINYEKLSSFYLPAQITKPYFKNFLQKYHAATPALVVGNPNFTNWDEVFANTDPQELRKELGIPPNHRVIVFAGGYDSSYQKYLNIFIKGVENLPQTTVLITYHPKTDGSVEREATSNFRNIRVVDEISTATLCVVADLLACHRSSISWQASYKEVPVLFVDSIKPPLSLLVTHKLALVAETPDQVARALKKTAPKKKGSPTLKPLGIPIHATEQIANQLIKAMGETSNVSVK